jgi:formiminotetrahydrofolate cyclodeaminase
VISFPLMLGASTINKFQKELSSKKVNPGGGVLSALAASFSASLIEMACNLSLGNVEYKNVQKSLFKIHKDTIEIKNKLSKLASDYEVVNDKKSLKTGIEIQMSVRKLSQSLEVMAYKIAKLGNKMARADAKTALYFAHAAGKSALEHIRHNQALIKNLS